MEIIIKNNNNIYIISNKEFMTVLYKKVLF